MYITIYDKIFLCKINTYNYCFGGKISEEINKLIDSVYSDDAKAMAELGYMYYYGNDITIVYY